MNTSRATLRRVEQHIAVLHDPDQTVAARAEANLIRYYGARAMESLLPLAHHKNPNVRFRIATVLGHTGDPRAYDALLRLSQDPIDIVRYDATIALGILGDQRAVEPLIVLMTKVDREEGVDNAAAISLERIGEPAIAPLVDLLNDSSPQVQCMAARVLGDIGHISAIEHLVPLLANEEECTRIAGIEALAAIGTSRCLSLIEGLLKDSSTRVRENASYWHQELMRKLSSSR